MADTHTAEMDAPCVFCNLDAIAGVEWCADTDGMSVYRFEPLNPVTPGHMLFVSDRHTRDAAQDPMLFGKVAEIAGWWVRSRGITANVITSVGAAATQSVFHLHVHVVPRVEGDGLALPWTGQTRVLPPGTGDSLG
jgi:histidine triad (HIT) family protein